MDAAEESMKDYDISIQRPSGSITYSGNIPSCACGDESKPAAEEEVTVSQLARITMGACCHNGSLIPHCCAELFTCRSYRIGKRLLLRRQASSWVTHASCRLMAKAT